MPASDLPFGELDAFDRTFFPAPRSGFLKNWISQEGSYACAAVNNSNITGYGVIRACRKGYKIGPLFAGTMRTAEALLSGLTTRIPEGSPFYLDIPGVNPSALKIAQKHALQPVFKTARMYNKKFPNLPLKKIFGITSFELG